MTAEPEPQHSIVVFDGVCVLCSRWVRFLLKYDHDDRFRFASMQSASGHRLLREYGLDPQAPQSLLLLEQGRGYTDTEAIARVLGSLEQRRWHALSAAILFVPMALRDPIYRFIARHRYRIFGRTETCYAPSAEQRARFMS